MDDSIFLDKFFAFLVTAFALLGVFLSCIGIFGLMAYLVSSRTSDIGIRKALGANSAEAMHLILKSSLKLAGIGLAVGILAVVPFGNLFHDYLYKVESHDPVAIGVGVGVVLILTASIAAAWIPAQRAAKISPMDALRVK